MTLGNAASGDPLRRSLNGWYRMLGNTNDSTGKASAGTAVNSPTLVADKYGNSDSAYSFTASSSQRISVAASKVYSDTVPFTIAMWFKAASGDGVTIYAEAHNTNGAAVLQVRTGSDKLMVFYRNAGSTIYISNVPTTATVCDNTWHHIAVVVNVGGGTCLPYVDGALDANSANFSFTTSAAMGITLNTANVGALERSTIGGYLTGSVSDLRLYTRALTAAEIGTLYRATQRI